MKFVRHLLLEARVRLFLHLGSRMVATFLASEPEPFEGAAPLMDARRTFDDDRVVAHLVLFVHEGACHNQPEED